MVMMQQLKPSEQVVLQFRFGLGGQECHSLSQVSEVLDFSKERFRQIQEGWKNCEASPGKRHDVRRPSEGVTPADWLPMFASPLGDRFHISNPAGQGSAGRPWRFFLKPARGDKGEKERGPSLWGKGEDPGKEATDEKQRRPWIRSPLCAGMPQ